MLLTFSDISPLGIKIPLLHPCSEKDGNMAFGSVVNVMNVNYPRDKTEAETCFCTMSMPTNAYGNIMILDIQYTSNSVPTECPVILDLPIKYKCIKSNHMHKSNMSFSANLNQMEQKMYETPLEIRRRPQATSNMRIWLQITGKCNYIDSVHEIWL